jgi:hypothetical protein
VAANLTGRANQARGGRTPGEGMERGP